MAFATAPAKAARAAAARKLQQQKKQQEEDNEGDSSLSDVNSSSTASTIVEIHDEEDPVMMTSFNQQCITASTFDYKPKSMMFSQGLSYTSLWPSARDVVVSTTAPPNMCPDAY